MSRKNATKHGQSFERHRTIRFELNEDLVVDGSAEATRMKFVDDDWELSDQIITVYDVDSLSGEDEDQGRAVWDPEAKRYEVISLNTKAKWIRFKINDATGLSPGDTSISVDTIVFYDGTDPGETLTVLTPEKWEADDDAVGWAWYDGNDYRMGNVDCPA